MKLEFQSMLFRTASDLCDAIAIEWLTAGGLNDEKYVAEALSDTSDDALALEVIQAWGLGLTPEPSGLSEAEAAGTWLEQRGIDADDIARAFARLRG